MSWRTNREGFLLHADRPKLRQQPISRGVLVVDGEHRRFMQDFRFGSPFDGRGRAGRRRRERP
jgi:hypothetical protein